MKKVLLLQILVVSVIFANIYSANQNGYNINLETGNINIAGSNEYSHITWESENKLDGFTATYTQTAGMPLLPVYRRIIRVPEDGEINVTVTFNGARKFSLEKTNLPNRIYPRQLSIPKSGDEPEFVINDNFYNNPLPYPSKLAEVERIGTMRGKHLAILTVYPVMWDNASSTIVHYKNMNISIDFDNPIVPLETRLVSRPYRTLSETEILEPMDIDPISTPECVYLIISAPEYADGLYDFKKALASYGYRVKHVTTDETGTTILNIDNYVTNAYNTWPVAPTFVLLVGDFDDVTADVVPYGWDEHPSDLYYFTPDGGDYIPDMMYGRFCVSSNTELDNIVRKTINYYNYTFTRYDLFDKIAFAACGTDGRYEVAMSSHQYAMDEYFHAPDFSPDSVWAIDGGDTDDVLRIINDGVFLFNYSGHCGVSGWSNPTLENEHISDMANQFHPLLIGNCCLSGKFDEDCFGEEVTTYQNGAAAYIGASNSTFWDEDDVWERRMYDGIYEENYAHLYSFIYKGNYAVYLEYEDNAQYYFEIYHCFGDPAMTLYFGEPDSIDIDMSGYDFLPAGAFDYTFFSSADSSWVVLSDDDSLIAAERSRFGEATLSLSEVLVYPDTIRLVAHKNNFWRPFIVDLPLAPASEFAFSPDSIPVTLESAINVNLEDSDGSAIDGAMVIISGYGLNDTSYTDPTGSVTMNITPPYIETLSLKAYSEGSLVGMGNIVVYGSSTWTAWVDSVYTPEIELYDSLAVGFEGTCDFRASVSGFFVKVTNVDRFMYTSETDIDLISSEFTPSVENDYTVTFLKEGYPVIESAIDVCIPMATPSFYTYDSDGDLPGSNVALFEEGSDVDLDDPLFAATTNSLGRYTHTRSYPCGYYILYASKFGYDPVELPVILSTSGYFEVLLESGGRAYVYGNIGEETRARVTLLDPLTKNIVDDTVSDFDGNFYFYDIPFFTYDIVIGARSYNRLLESAEIDDDTVYLEYSIEYNDEPILIIDNSDGEDSPAEFTSAILDYYGFIPTVVGDFELEDLFDYEIVIYSCGLNGEPVDEDQLAILLEYRNYGGHVLIEGGELTYDLTDRAELAPLYASSLLIASDWESDDPGEVVVSSAWEPTMSPFIDPGFMEEAPEFHSFTFRDWFIYDIVEPAEGSRIIYESTDNLGMGPVIVRDDIENDGFYHAMMLALSIADAFTDDDERAAFIANSIEYARERDWAKVVVTGTAMLEGVTEHGGIDVYTDSESSVTNYDGRFSIHCSYEDPVEIMFSYPGYRDTFMVIMEDPGEYRLRTYISLRREDRIIENLPLSYDISGIYPNPANTSFNVVVFNDKEEVGTLELVDIRGNVVLTEELSLISGETTKTINGNSIQTGVYSYKISNNKSTIKTGKFIMMK